MAPIVVSHTTGSSPRVRGTPFPPRQLFLRRRFIPACAGNSLPRPPRLAGPPVHPRVCGELKAFGDQAGSLAGSSPRVRGTPPSQEFSGGLGRFIPACAGNSAALASAAAPLGGSSPRVRGTRPKGTCRCRSPPVHPRVCGELCAELCVKARWPAVHPRVCGELCVLPLVGLVVGGSSPRVRGTPW